jgi:hypothetical protein
LKNNLHVCCAQGGSDGALLRMIAAMGEKHRYRPALVAEIGGQTDQPRAGTANVIFGAVVGEGDAHGYRLR